MKLFIMRGFAPRGKIDKKNFVCNFVTVESIGELYAYFLPIVVISLFFHPLPIFFSPNMLFGHIPPGWGGGIYTPACFTSTWSDHHLKINKLMYA